MPANAYRPMNLMKKAVEDVDIKTLSLGTVISVLTVFMPVWFYLDSHFAHADDVTVVRKSTTEQITDLRKQMLEDKIFEIEVKDKQTKVDKALLDRYKSERDSLSRKQQQDKEEKAK